jgi:hypothetical protein
VRVRLPLRGKRSLIIVEQIITSQLLMGLRGYGNFTD